MTDRRTSSKSSLLAAAECQLLERQLAGWPALMFQIRASRKSAEKALQIAGRADARKRSGGAATSAEEIDEFAACTAHAVSEYAKCFGKGAHIRLDKKKVFREHPDESSDHDAVIDFRNSVTAHSFEHELVEFAIEVSEKAGEVVVGFRASSTMPRQIINALLRALPVVESHIGPMPAKRLRKLSQRVGVPIRLKSKRDL